MTTTEYASLDDLTAASAADSAEDLTLSNGKVVKVRGLTRAEFLWIGKGTEDAAEIEARLISKGLVAPAMTFKQVQAWQASSTSTVISEISDKLRELSGFGEGAAKRGVPADGDDRPGV